MKEEPEVALAKLRAMLPVIIEHEKLKAKVARAKYLALLEEGFSEEQAIQLCRTTN